jgi:hypothetical protein
MRNGSVSSVGRINAEEYYDSCCPPESDYAITKTAFTSCSCSAYRQSPLFTKVSREHGDAQNGQATIARSNHNALGE